MTKTETNARTVEIANRHPRLTIDREAIRQAIHLLDAEFPFSNSGTKSVRPVPPGELSLVFVTDVELAQLHADFLDDPSITDVITFEGDAMVGTAGEICVSADAAIRQTGRSASRAKSAFSHELTLYVVHGWLHLAGFDDLQPAKKRVMRRAEARAMSLLRANRLLPSFRIR